MLKECDKCFSKIVNGKCSCGIWLENEECPNAIKIFEKAINTYDHLYEQNRCEKVLGMDHYSGNCAVFFKGNYEKCEKVKNFIRSLD